MTVIVAGLVGLCAGTAGTWLVVRRLTARMGRQLRGVVFRARSLDGLTWVELSAFDLWNLALTGAPTHDLIRGPVLLSVGLRSMLGADDDRLAELIEAEANP